MQSFTHENIFDNLCRLIKFIKWLNPFPLPGRFLNGYPIAMLFMSWNFSTWNKWLDPSVASACARREKGLKLKKDTRLRSPIGEWLGKYSITSLLRGCKLPFHPGRWLIKLIGLRHAAWKDVFNERWLENIFNELFGSKLLWLSTPRISPSTSVFDHEKLIPTANRVSCINIWIIKRKTSPFVLLTHIDHKQKKNYLDV